MCPFSFGILFIPRMLEVLIEGREIKEIYQN